MRVAPDFALWAYLRSELTRTWVSAIVKKGRRRQNCIVRVRTPTGRTAHVSIHFIDHVEYHDYDLDDLKF